jgi:hypothetical protein
MSPAIVVDGTAQTTIQDNPAPRLRNRLAASKWIVLATFLSLLTLYATVHSYLQNQDELGRWGCRMSWMSPNYVRLDGPQGAEVKGLERKYALWLYREGGLQPDLQVRACSDDRGSKYSTFFRYSLEVCPSCSFLAIQARSSKSDLSHRPLHISFINGMSSRAPPSDLSTMRKRRGIGRSSTFSLVSI